MRVGACGAGERWAPRGGRGGTKPPPCLGFGWKNRRGGPWRGGGDRRAGEERGSQATAEHTGDRRRRPPPPRVAVAVAGPPRPPAPRPLLAVPPYVTGWFKLSLCHWLAGGA